MRRRRGGWARSWKGWGWTWQVQGGNDGIRRGLLVRVACGVAGGEAEQEEEPSAALSNRTHRELETCAHIQPFIHCVVVQTHHQASTNSIRRPTAPKFSNQAAKTRSAVGLTPEVHSAHRRLVCNKRARPRGAALEIRTVTPTHGLVRSWREGPALSCDKPMLLLIKGLVTWLDSLMKCQSPDSGACHTMLWCEHRARTGGHLCGGQITKQTGNASCRLLWNQLTSPRSLRCQEYPRYLSGTRRSCCRVPCSATSKRFGTHQETTVVDY